jgi:hypothetical protein
VERSDQWLVCAAILFGGGIVLTLFGLLVGGGPLGGVLLFATGVGALLVARRFRKLERTSTLEDFNRQLESFW